MEYKHIPVMLEEVLGFIDLKKGNKVIDCTLGGANYTLAIARLVGDEGSVISFDLDNLAIKNAKKIIKDKKIDNITLINDGFDNLKERLSEIGEDEGFQAVVMDLGLSSAQLVDERRGFSFQKDTILDMTFGGQGEDGNATQEIINYTREKELEKILSQYGGEKFARKIAAGIVKARKIVEIKRTGELISIIEDCVPSFYKNNSKIHFATRAFQAFRIASNDELTRLERALPQALNILKPGGKIAVVSFHSLEDRIVKQFFKKENRDCICPPEIPICRCEHKSKIKIITKKPIGASAEEIKKNPRSRSAKLRVAEKK